MLGMNEEPRRGALLRQGSPTLKRLDELAHRLMGHSCPSRQDALREYAAGAARVGEHP